LGEETVSDTNLAIYTDRRELTTQAYADSKNLDARASIYHYQEPRIDLVEWALAQVSWGGAERVLDVGCGPGRYLQRLALQPGLRLIGLDLSRGMLADLRRRWDPATPRPYLATADAQALPLADASCDVALAIHMLYHVPDIEQAARELRRVLRSGGALLALTNGRDHLFELDEAFAGAVSAISGQPGPRLPRGRFSLENGESFLLGAFEQIERHEITGALLIPDAAPVLTYIASTRSMTEKLLPDGVTWEALICEIERMVMATIAEQGVFKIRTFSGVFVCR
jgi:SAM-dependent methyltransferase